MSEVYVKEPPLKGKVILHTSNGDLDVELWSKECPKACRNFVQLCLEGYYDGSIFHRLIPEFIIQGGDPTETGKGGESIYGQGFSEEFHSRLQFRYRGLVGMANLGRGTNTNNSQFFITLGRCDNLNGKNTLFGKLTGHSTYNLIKMGELPTNPDTDKPLDPPLIKSTEVLWNPFPDIEPRKSALAELEESAEPTEDSRRETLSQRKQNLLSFEEDQDEKPVMHSGKSKSAHDLLEDPTLLKETGKAMESEIPKKRLRELNIEDDGSEDEGEQSKRFKCGKAQDESSDLPSVQRKLAQFGATSKLPGLCSKSGHGMKLSGLVADYESDDSGFSEENVLDPAMEERKARAEEILSLKQDISALSFKKQRPVVDPTNTVPNSDLMTEYEKRHQVYLQKKRNVSGTKRQQEVFDKLQTFGKQLKTLKALRTEEEKEEIIAEGEGAITINPDEVINESDGKWLKKGGLKFAVDSARAYDLDAANEALEVFDPLNPEEAREAMRRKRVERRMPTTQRFSKSTTQW